MHRRAAVVLWICLVAATAPRSASACSLFYCEPPFVAPAEAATVPSTARALIIHPSWPEFVADYETDPPVLHRPDGSVVPTRLDADGSLSLQAPLTAGAGYRLVYPRACDWNVSPGRQDGGVPSTERSFTVGAAALPPTLIGVARQGSARTGQQEVGFVSGSCTGPIQAAMVSLEIQLDASLVPWLPLTLFTLVVDGQEWAGPHVGQLQPDGSLVFTGPPDLPNRPKWGRKVNQLFAGCHPSELPFSDHGLPLGTHQVLLTAHVAGVGDLPPVALEATLACESELADASGCGPCNLGGRGAGSPAGLTALAVLLGAALLRRRAR